MLNDRDPNIKGPNSEEGETEYHFSDEDVSYELEDEEAPSEEQKVATSQLSLKDKLLTRLNTSRRMIVTLVVFLVLIFAVYKMVSPTTSKAPSTEIKPAVATTTPAPSLPSTPPQGVVAVSPPPQALPQAAPQEVPPQVTQAAPAPPPAQGVMGEQTPPPQAPSTLPTVTVQAKPVPVAQTEAPPTTNAQAAPPIQPSPTALQQMQPPQVAAPPQPTTAVAQPVTAEPVVGMPQVIPVQPPIANVANQQPQTAIPSTAMTPESAKLMSDLQAEYMQRLNDFAAQNKNIGDEVQLLNSRVSSLEAEINQLSQQLMQKSHLTSPREERTGPTLHPPEAAVEPVAPHVSYSVQAIIPGRAWLRSDNGETLTVTEGDYIRDLGRITKIDPYDGVVEVNTGTKVVSISYGTGT